VRSAEVLASRILFWGGVLSITLMTLGIIGFAARGGLTPELLAESRRIAHRELARPPGVFVSVAEVGRAVSRWPVDPLAIVATGILLLLATPFTAVVALGVVFAVTGERRYAAVAAVLVGALLVSLLYVNR
jgi:uncharacterized membrane protein